MKKKILIGAIALMSVFGGSLFSNNQPKASICHLDMENICCLPGQGPWMCYCLPPEKK